MNAEKLKSKQNLIIKTMGKVKIALQKVKRKFRYVLLLKIVVVGELFFLTSCLNKNEELTDPIVATLPVSQTTYSSAIVGANLISQGSYEVMDWGVCFSTTPNPTYDYRFPSNYQSFGGVRLGSNTATINGLTENTTYYLRAYAFYLKTSYGSEVTFTTQKLDTIIRFNPNLTYGSLSDIEGNTYKTIQIGTQVWMAENLKVSKYRDGSDINKMSTINWNSTDTIGIYNDFEKPAYVSTFGYLYNFYAVIDSRNLCPTGWHVPSDSEWTLFENYLGNSSVAGGKLKEVGTSHWSNLNTGATNESGFTALPGGGSFGICGYRDVSNTGYWWSPKNSEYISGYMYRCIECSGSNVFNNNDPEGYGCAMGFQGEDFASVRCIKDN